MKQKTLLILAVALVVVSGLAALTLQTREGAVRSADGKTKLFPALATAAKDAATIVVERKDGAFTLQRGETGWGLAEKDGFAVEAEPVRKLLLTLAEMETVEPKTSSPALYAQLGVEDVGAEGAKSALVTVKDTSGQELAKLIVGKRHESKNYSAQESFVRRPGEALSWLVKGQIDLKEKGADWLSKKVLEIKRERVRAVEITHPDGHKVRADRETPEKTDYTLYDIPEGRELKYATVANTLSSGLEYVNLDDVQPAGQVDFTKDPGPTATFRCFDGLEVTVTCKEQDGKTYAQFTAAFVEPPATAAPIGPEIPADPAATDPEAPNPAKKAPEEVKKEVDELNARLSKWTYVISTYNRSAYYKRMDELVKDTAPPPPPPGEGGANSGEIFKIPGDLPPEIQEQIKKDLESRGEKAEIVKPTPGTDEPKKDEGGTPPADPHPHPHPHPH